MWRQGVSMITHESTSCPDGQRGSSRDPADEDVLATTLAADYPAHPVTWILRELVGQPARLETFLNDVDETLSDCRAGTANLDDVMTLLAYWITILKLRHEHV